MITAMIAARPMAVVVTAAIPAAIPVAAVAVTPVVVATPPIAAVAVAAAVTTDAIAAARVGADTITPSTVASNAIASDAVATALPARAPVSALSVSALTVAAGDIVPPAVATAFPAPAFTAARLAAIAAEAGVLRLRSLGRLRGFPGDRRLASAAVLAHLALRAHAGALRTVSPLAAPLRAFRPIAAAPALGERGGRLGRQHEGQGRHHQTLHRQYKSDLGHSRGPQSLQQERCAPVW